MTGEFTTPLILKSTGKGLPTELIKIIAEISNKSFTANDQEIGIMYIAGHHWKHMKFVRWKTLEEAVKIRLQNK